MGKVFMASAKKFSRFLIWTLIVFEAASLALVLGILYTLLSSSMEKDFRHQVEVRQVETSMALHDRISLLRSQLHDISLSNTIRVSLMLGVRNQILETMKAKYPSSNGAFFFVWEKGRSEFIPRLPKQFSPLKLKLLELEEDPIDKGIVFERMGNGHYICLFSVPIKRRTELLGRAYLIYDFSSDLAFWLHMDVYPHSNLLILEGNRLLNPRTGQQEALLTDSDISRADIIPGKFFVPLKGFPGLFYCASSAPLQRGKMNLLLILLSLCVGVFFLTMLVAFIIVRRVSRPLEQISDQALEIAKNPVKPSIDEKQIRYLEFRKLVQGFNEVLKALVQAKERLKQKAEEKLRESEERYRKTFDASPYSITISRLSDSRFLEVNEAFCKMTGYSKEEVIGKTSFDLNLYISTADRNRLLDALKTDGEVTNLETQFRKKNGEVIIGLFSARTLQYEGHECMVALVADITERKEAEKERERLEAQLRQAQKMEAIGTLAGGIAHDFRNILQAIMGYSEILMLDLDEAGVGQEEVREIRRAAERASELTQQLLTFGRKVESKLRPVDLNHEIRQAHKLLERILPKTISIQLNLDKDIEKINADPAQIEQVLLNLAINARDAMPDGGRLIIETGAVKLDEKYCEMHLGARPGKYALLSVTDTGQGMDKETVEHIFEPFYTTKGSGKGTGLGLAMVYGIVKSHGGYIVCYSEPRLGTSFKIYLPTLEQEAYSQHSREQLLKEQIPRGQGETILVIDDDKAVLDIVKKVLSRFGYQVLTASDARSGIQTYKKGDTGIDLVILDYMMPEIDGAAALKEIHEINPDAKIVIASGYSLDSSKEEEIGRMARGFLKKPFNLDQMLGQIRRIIDEP